MQKQSIIYGLIGLILGGLVSFSIFTIIKDDAVQPTTEKQMDHSMTMNDMTESLIGKTGDDFDKAFISSMIEHHQGAIDMAQEAKKNSKHAEIKNMADDIIKAQSQEIEQMEKWEAEWGYMRH